MADSPRPASASPRRRRGTPPLRRPPPPRQSRSLQRASRWWSGHRPRRHPDPRPYRLARRLEGHGRRGAGLSLPPRPGRRLRGQPPRGNARGRCRRAAGRGDRALHPSRGLRRPAIVGHSMGGTVAMMVAARHPRLVGKVMVVDMLPQPAGLLGGDAAGMRGLADSLRDLSATPGGGGWSNWRSDCSATRKAAPTPTCRPRHSRAGARPTSRPSCRGSRRR